MKKIQDQAKAKLVKSGKLYYGENHPKDKSLSPNGENLSDKKIHTDKELAKMAGVGTGTVARYDTVMNSDNKGLQQSILSGDVKIGTAYKQVINERKKK